MNFVFLLVLSALIVCESGSAQSIVVTPIHTFNSHESTSVATDPISLFIGKFDGSLYGVTYRDQTNGTIFSLKADGSGYAVLHSFAPGEEAIAGAGFVPGQGYPTPSVLQGNDGNLYGTTPKGGANDSGTFFRLNPNGSGYTVLHEFTAADGGPGVLIQASGGAFYGAGAGIFKIDGNGNNYTVLYSFTNSADGFALASLAQGSDGVLYGATVLGGAYGSGTVFSIATNGTGFKVLHSFAGVDGGNPSSLIQGSDGALYGTTSGTYGITNTIFKIGTNGDGFLTLRTFINASNGGFDPLGALVEGASQVLYGTTYEGNINGTVFKIGMDGSGYSSLYNFTNATAVGAKPITGLVKDPNNAGVFYGTTSTGGGPSTGSVFAALIYPPITITPVVSQTASNQTVVFWPKWAGTYALQSTTNIASSNWVNVSDGTPVFGVQVTSTNPAVFYRLVSP